MVQDSFCFFGFTPAPHVSNRRNFTSTTADGSESDDHLQAIVESQRQTAKISVAKACWQVDIVFCDLIVEF